MELDRKWNCDLAIFELRKTRGIIHVFVMLRLDCYAHNQFTNTLTIGTGAMLRLPHTSINRFVFISNAERACVCVLGGGEGAGCMQAAGNKYNSR